MPIAGYAVAIRLQGDGLVVESLPIEGDEVDYETLNAAVDGYIERVQVHIPAPPGDEFHAFDVDVWVNEEGLLKGLDFNPLASAFASMLTGREYTLVGNCIITGTDPVEGATPPLSEYEARVVGQLMHMLAGRIILVEGDPS
jgi:hypothetical protein